VTDPFPPDFRVVDQEFDPAIPVVTIREHPDNPNEGDTGVIAESLDENGFYGAIMVQKSTGHIVAGNHRYRVAVAARAATIPGFWLSITDAQAAKILAVDNRSSRLGADDAAKLVALLSPLPSLAGTGYSARDLDAMVARLTGQPTRGELLELAGVTVAEPAHQPKDGQVWALGWHRLAVVDLHTGWPVWAPLLGEGSLFVPYPTPLVPHGVQVPLVMVQPDPYLAALLLDKWADVTGTPPVLVP
jgi:hypothetical protein